jgi:hypothetical protein
MKRQECFFIWLESFALKKFEPERHNGTKQHNVVNRFVVASLWF